MLIAFLQRSIMQRFYQSNRLRRQGLDSFGAKVVIKAVIISKFLYDCQTFSGFLCASDLSRFHAFLNKAYRYKVSAIKYAIKNLLVEHGSHLYEHILLHPDNCLRDIFPPKPR
jgi:hypothetical protein